MMNICTWSFEENEDGSRKWTFHTSVSTVKHEEWKMREIPAYIGLMTDTQRGHSVVRSLRALAITEFHDEMDYWDRDNVKNTKPHRAFLKVRPD